MSLAELRDLFIVIFSILAIGATVFLLVLSFLLFRRIRSILDSGRATLGNARDITSLVSKEIIKPLAAIAGMVQGLQRALEFMSRFSKRKEGRKSDRGE
ncbi:MAG: hypothetical protein ACE5IE_04845 [Dehalococcoidia bacterium]